MSKIFTNENGGAAIAITAGLGAAMVMAVVGMTLATSASNKRQLNHMEREEAFYTSEIGAVHSYVTNQCDVQAPQYDLPFQATPSVAESMVRRFSGKNLRASLTYDSQLNRYCGQSNSSRGRASKRLCIIGQAPPSMGSLDSSFDNDGVALSGFPNYAAIATHMITQTDNKIIVVAYHGAGGVQSGFLLRYGTDGSLDSTFGTNGKAVFTYPGLGRFWFTSGVLQPQSSGDSKIVVIGEPITSPSSLSGRFLARFHSNGQMDTTFGNSGAILLPPGTGDKLHASPDGKIIVSWAQSAAGFRFARLLDNGTLDTSFGNNGFQQVMFFGFNEIMTSITFQNDNKLVATGYVSTQAGPFVSSNIKSALLRLLPNGNLDINFGNGGKTLSDFTASTTANSSGQAVALQNDQKILVAGVLSGNTPLAMALARFNSDGTPDLTFGAGGKVITRFNCVTSTFAGALKVESNSITVFGTVQIKRDTKTAHFFALANYQMDGQLSNAFERENGKELIPIPNNMTRISHSALDSSGKIVAAIEAFPFYERFTLTRIIP